MKKARFLQIHISKIKQSYKPPDIYVWVVIHELLGDVFATTDDILGVDVTFPVSVGGMCVSCSWCRVCYTWRHN